MISRERVISALNHKQPDKVPMDFGATAVTGMHVSCVAGLREHYGLAKGPVKAAEPYQMLGLIDEDLKQVLGVDTEGIPTPRTMFGFAHDNWKEWRTPWGQDVLVPQEFNTTRDADGNIFIHPQGDLSAPASGMMPSDGYFFDTIIRQDPIDEGNLNPEDNLEEFGHISQSDIDYFKAKTAAARATGRAVIANFGGTAFGDIALVPAPFLKHPRGIRDITEWYMATQNGRPSSSPAARWNPSCPALLTQGSTS